VDVERRCLVLFSGGLDSTTCLSIARREGFEPVALVFRYGQRHFVEAERALALLRAEGIPHHTIDLDLQSLGHSALTDLSIEVPLDRTDEELAVGPIPATYVPARNTIFLTFAVAWAEVLQIQDVYIGINALDFSGYPDCRPEYLEAYERMANLATRAAVEEGRPLRFHAPLLPLTKAEIIRWGLSLGVDYSKTWSCYAPLREPRGWVACGRCDSCHLRLKGFREAGAVDPLTYAEPS
jgi:7-cyano-7-deazaguanine synthase